MEISLATSRWISACELLTDVQMLVWTAASLEAPFHCGRRLNNTKHWGSC